MARRIIISNRAYADIDRIVTFNNQRNQSDTYSKKFIKSLFVQLQILERYGTIGVKTTEINTYVLIWDRYYIFYCLADNNNIEITSIRHHKENVL